MFADAHRDVDAPKATLLSRVPQLGVALGRSLSTLTFSQPARTCLIADGAWWLPTFWFTDKTDLTIDICTPSRLDGDVWSFVDLELDLFRATDGRLGIVDEDEFDELARSGHVPESHLATATEAARMSLPLVEKGAEPFGQAARAWHLALRAHCPSRG